MKKLSDLTKNEVVHCRTQEEWNAIIAMNPKNDAKECVFDAGDAGGICYNPGGREGAGTWDLLGNYNGGRTIYPASDFLHSPETDCQDSANEPIDEITIDRLDMALRACGIPINKDLLDDLIDVFELLLKKRRRCHTE